MAKLKINQGFSLIESMVCLVIIGIGFIAINQLASTAIVSMDRSLEKNKVNFLAEMMIEDIIANPLEASSSGHGSFNEYCNYSKKSGTSFLTKQHNKWMDKLKATNQIKIDNKYIIPRCDSAKDKKKIYINNTPVKIPRTSVSLNFFTGKGKQKKYLGIIVK